MNKTTNGKLKFLRFLPLLAGGVIGVVLCGGLCVQAVLAAGTALVSTVLRGGWVCGPLLLAICAAFLLRDRAARIVFDVVLVALTLMDLAALALCVLPFVRSEEVFFWVPLLQFSGLTGLMVATGLGIFCIPKLANLWRSETLKGV